MYLVCIVAENIEHCKTGCKLRRWCMVVKASSTNVSGVTAIIGLYIFADVDINPSSQTKFILPQCGHVIFGSVNLGGTRNLVPHSQVMAL